MRSTAHHSTPHFALLLLILAAVVAGPSTAELPKAEDCHWVPGFTMPGLDHDVLDITTRMTPSGVEVVAAGTFTYADGSLANGVARWSGSRWEPYEGPAGVGVDGPVHAVEFFGSDLYAAGLFDHAGGVRVNNIARWTGDQWKPIGEPAGVSSFVGELEVIDDGTGPALYAVGFFGVGNTGISGVAKWDGQTWSDLGRNFADPTSLTYGDIGGGPTFFVGLSGGPVLERRGETWEVLDNDFQVDYTTRALTIHDDGSGPALYAAGQDYLSFPSAFVTRWNGSEWIALPNLGDFGFEQVEALESIEIDGQQLLIATGDFPALEIGRVGHIAAWDGSTWQPLTQSGQGLSFPGNTLHTVENGGDSYLLVGGGFNLADGIPASRIARWDGGASWSALETDARYGDGVDDGVYQFITWDDGTGEALYMAGHFDVAGGRRVNGIARWNGASWEPLEGPNGIGVSGWIDALAIYDDGNGEALYVGGFFQTAGGVEANHVARWDGKAWSALADPDGIGVSRSVRDLAVWDDGNGPALYVGGTFNRAGGMEAGHVAKWDGTWQGLDEPNGPRFGVALSMEPFDDGSGEALFVSGFFRGTASDDRLLDATAKWDGQSWQFVGRGALSRWVEDLEVWDDGTGPALYAAGDDGDLARFNGLGFEQVSDGVFQWIRDLQVWDDGNGSKLYAAGRGLSWFPGLESDYVASWDGSSWSSLGDTTEGEPNRLTHALFPWQGDGSRSLLVGGDFGQVGTLQSSHVAQWACGARAPCETGSEHLLCLGTEDRFHLDISWRDFEGNEGSGRVVPFQTRDSGLFYFFGPDNWELLVKVLDGCGINDHFWVFSAATTNVEYTLTVTDAATGASKTYFNPLGTAAAAVTDTAAFPTCGDAFDAPVDRNGSAESAGSMSPEALGLEKTTSTQELAKADCTPTDTTMCLEGGRFALEIDWRDFEGNVGPGKVVADVPADGSGLFQFFGANNWEVLVKVLDGCSLNDRFWVFSAATTNVEYTLRVTDTETGETVDYFNPLGNAADAVTDTDAFGTCN